MVKTVSDKRLLQLWRDPNFSGSYRGIKTFQTLLKTDLNVVFVMEISEFVILNVKNLISSSNLHEIKFKIVFVRFEVIIVFPPVPLITESAMVIFKKVNG